MFVKESPRRWLLPAFALLFGIFLCPTRTHAASLAELHGFSSAPSADAGIVLGPDGALYGATIFGGAFSAGSIFKVTTNGNYSTLVSFDGTNGFQPESGLTIGQDGNLYGTAYAGYGAPQDGFFPPGFNVFRVTTSGVLTSLAILPLSYQLPPGNLLRSTDGTLYGKTSDGAFRLATDGTFTNFDVSGDGVTPVALALGNDGNLYGTIQEGGDYSLGGIFQLTPGGNVSVVHSFDGTNGSFPSGNLVVAPDGSIYGATSGNSISNFPATMFRFTTDGGFSNVYLFPPTAFAISQLCAVDDAGAIYGTGPNIIYLNPPANYPTNGYLFRVTAAGDYSTNAIFDGTNGAYPQPSMARDANGNLYGVTSSGGQSGVGTVYQLTTNGNLSALASFDATGGLQPNALVQGVNGNLYGTTSFGGAGGGFGTAFQVTTNGVFTHFTDFSNANATPVGNLAEASDGFYGLQPGGYFKLSLDGSLTNYPFNWNGTLGYASLMTGMDGRLYGTGATGFAKLFVLPPGGTPAVLVATNDTNLTWPISLLQGSNGVLYGIASTINTPSPFGPSPLDQPSNSVFQCTTNGIASTLAAFPSTNVPFQLALGLDGSFYGMAALNTNVPAQPPQLSFPDPNPTGFAAFRVSPAGVVSNLSYLAPNTYDDSSTSLITGSNGDFYSLSPLGRLCQITTNGVVTRLVFTDPGPIAALPLRQIGGTVSTSFLQGPGGDFYGTFPDGGSHNGGFVFRYTLRPTLQPTARGNGYLFFMWDALPNRPYQLQSSPGLNPPNWTNVGGPASTTNYFISGSDNPGASNRFYRVIQPPSP